MQSGRENKELIHCVGQKTSWKQTTSETKVQVAKITDKYLVTTGFTQNRPEQNRTEQNRTAFDYRRIGARKQRIS